MKNCTILIILFFYIFKATIAQTKFSKPPIDTSVFDKWTSVFGGKISNDGKFITYIIRNQPVHSQTCIIQSTNNKWKKEFTGTQTADFTNDSRIAIFKIGQDTLCLLSLVGDATEYINSVKSFQLYRHGKDEMLAYQLNNVANQLNLRNMKTKKEQRFENVNEYILSKKGNLLVYISEAKEVDKAQKIKWVDLQMTNSKKIIWSGINASNLILDEQGTQLAFSSNDADRSIWYYNNNMHEARNLIINSSAGLGDNLFLNELSRFSFNGERIFFNAKEKDFPIPNSNSVQVDVWNYADAKLQSQQLIEDIAGYGRRYIGAKKYDFVLNIKSRNSIQLQKKNEELLPLSNSNNDDWVLITYQLGDKNESEWNESARPKYYLMSTVTGKRKQTNIQFTQISPGSRYLLGDDNLGNFYSYDVQNDSIRNITKSVPLPVGNSDYDEPYKSKHRGLSFWGKWLPYDESLFIQDNYDIWKIDPIGVKPPLNITNGYGRKNNITFNFIDDGYHVYESKSKEVIYAFDNKNKNNGFYRISFFKIEDPIKLKMEARVFNWIKPIKARDIYSYLLLCSSAGNSPNYYYTTDFIELKSLSNVNPEVRYNWISAELHCFKTLDGRKEQGVLYKPENFDPQRKYPVIINYYERNSENLNQYLKPDFSDGNINIPYFVSNGYIVFSPDIHYETGKIGLCAYNSILGSREYLKQFPYINSKRMGLSGHSFGAFETNYVITHSNEFAAACSDAGVSNYVNRYNTYELNSGIGLQSYMELYQSRMGYTLWENPSIYFYNSPILYANKVTTPLLMINNKLDAMVHFEQGVQLFMALRRLNKKVWMLQYEGEQHSLYQKKNKKDLTIRMTQFFNHYLNDKPAPKWMLDGIPAKLKGIDSGYDLDTTGRKPGNGLLTSEEKLKVDSLINRKPITIIVE